MRRLSKPLEDGFIMPAEFEHHSGCLMLWPYRKDNWREQAIPAAITFATVANLISTSEQVFMGIHHESVELAQRLLSPRVQLLDLAYNDSWMRDIGPTFIKNRSINQIRAIDWDFNAWGGEKGGLYQNWQKDAKLCEQLLDDLSFTLKDSSDPISYYKPNVVLEGGAIHVDGKGTLIAVEECVLNENRNHGITKKQMESIFTEYLGIQKTIWLPLGVHNDETDGHVDNLCCFAPDSCVLLTWTDDENDPQYPISKQAYDILSHEKDAQKQPIMVEKIHQPQPLYMSEQELKGLEQGDAKKRSNSDRLVASYVNFYVSNHAVILPVFNDRKDTHAIKTIQKHFPNRDIIPVYSREILLGGGNIHCITQQIPGRD